MLSEWIIIFLHSKHTCVKSVKNTEGSLTNERCDWGIPSSHEQLCKRTLVQRSWCSAPNCETVLNCQKWYFKLFEINHSTLWSDRASGLELNDKNSICKSKKLLLFFLFDCPVFFSFVILTLMWCLLKINWYDMRQKPVTVFVPKDHSKHLCDFKLHLILVCCTILALWRCLVTLPAVDQNHQQVSCLPKYRVKVCAAQGSRDNEAFVQFRVPAGVPSCTVSLLIFIWPLGWRLFFPLFPD